MNDEIEKSEPSPDDVLAAIQSFNDPSIITNIFRELGWSYSLEIKETLTMAKQNANLSIKFKAIKHLRELLREAAETAGYVANVSQTYPNAQGGSTTFHAKRIANILNPTKQIESTIKESKNDKKETRTEPDRGSDRRQSKRPESSGELHEGVPNGTDRGQSQAGENSPTDTRRAFPAGDADVGGVEPPDGGETPRPVPGGTNSSDSSAGATDDSDSEKPNPCIKTKPPTCDRELFPGISSAGD